MEESQEPEYNNRLRRSEKRLEQQKIQTEMKNRKVLYEKSIGFDNIKGQHELINAEIKMIVDYLKHPLKYNNNNGKVSMLFYGPPGNGKTLIARSIAKESGALYLEITADDILHENSREKILAVWKLAEQIASQRKEKSAIIYIDEIDCVVGNRKHGTLDPIRAKALSNLLAIFDGIEKHNPHIKIVVIITTNHEEELDPALKRPGRIDRKIRIGTPTAAGRQEFFESLVPAQNKHLVPHLVQQSDNLSGAEISNLVDNAQMVANYNGRTAPTKQDYDNALQRLKTQIQNQNN